MLNTITFITLVPLLLIESYKFVLLKRVNGKIALVFQPCLSNFLLIELFVITILLLNMLSSGAVSEYTTFLFFISFVVYSLYLKKCDSNTNALIVICMVMSVVSSRYVNLIVFIFLAELFSIITFFVLFCNTTSSDSAHKTSLTYFFVTNILTFFWGLITSVYHLYYFGTTNLFFLTHLVQEHFLFTISLILYAIFKFGQGPAVLFKFKFYRLTTLNDVLFYIFFYVVLIWPVLLHIVSTLFQVINWSLLFTFVIISTAYITYSLFTYSSFWDFIVFSTWVFLWFSVLYSVL